MLVDRWEVSRDQARALLPFAFRLSPFDKALPFRWLVELLKGLCPNDERKGLPFRLLTFSSFPI